MISQMSKLFTDDRIVMTIIILNATLFIALDLNPDLSNEIGAWINWIDFACVVFFIIEASVKITNQNFKRYIKDHWNKLDFFIVIASIPVLIEPFIHSIGAEFGWVGVFRIARVFRLTRVLRTLRIIQYTRNSPSEVFKKIRYPIYLVLGIAFSHLLIEIFDLSSRWTNQYFKYYPGVIVVNMTWLVSRLYNVFHQAQLQRDSSKINEAVESIVNALAQIFIWTLGLILAFEATGLNTTTIFAGVGLGGMAIALAAQDFIANLIGGILLYSKNSFKVGDNISIGGYQGTVMKLGISDIRVNDQSGKVTSLPNKMFISQPIENRTEANLAPDTITLKINKNIQSNKLNDVTQIILNEARSNNFIKEDYSIRFGPMSGNVHELIFEYFLDKKELDIAFPEEPLYELVNQQNARIYIGIIKSLQNQNIDLG